MSTKQSAKMQALVNWLYGNYCTRKCHDETWKQQVHVKKLQELAKKMEGTMMTHSQFIAMLRHDKTICNLSDDDWNNRRWSWRMTGCQICKMLRLEF